MQPWLSLLTGVAKLLASFLHTCLYLYTLVAKGTACCMRALQCMLQITLSIIIAFTAASWETIKGMPCCYCIELTADCPPDQLHQLKDVRHQTLCKSRA